MIRSACLLLLLTVAAHAQGVAQSPTGPLRTAYTSVRVEADGDLARTTVTQVFVNDLSSPVEAEYGFPLPGDATVTGFAEWRGGRRVDARASAKETARKRFEAAVERGERATLAEKASDHAFKMTLHALPARGSARVELTYTQTLTALGGERAFVFPSRGADQPPSLLDVQVRVRGDREITALEVPNQLDAVVASTKDGWTAAVSRARSGLARDLVLRWRQDADPLDLAARAVRPDPDRPGFAEVRFAFNADPWTDVRPPQDVVIVVDTSLSMAGAPLENARALALQAVDALSPQDRFEVVAFSGGVRPAFGHLRFADPDARDEARAHLEGLRAGGRSNLQMALDFTGELLAETGDGVVLLATDGQPTFREGGTPFGLDVDPARFAEARVVIAHFNYPKRAKALEAVLPNVTTRYIPDGPAAKKAGESLVRLAVAPAIEDLSIEIDGAWDVSGRVPTRLAAGESVRLMARVEPAPDGTVQARIAGFLHGKPIEVELLFDVPPGPDGRGDRGLPVEWARLRIDDLGAEYARLRDEAEREVVEAQIRGLGTEYNLATRFTSYVLTDSLYPDHIKPGDPEIRVRAPASAQGVVAILPWGETVRCTWDAEEGLWLGRFLVPRHIKDGLYRARVLVEEQHATVYRGALFFRVDSKPPAYELLAEWKAGALHLRAVPADRSAPAPKGDHVVRDPVDLKAVTVSVGKQTWAMHRTDDPEVFTLELPAEKLPAGLKVLRMVATDFARNTSVAEIEVADEVAVR